MSKKRPTDEPAHDKDCEIRGSFKDLLGSWHNIPSMTLQYVEAERHVKSYCSARRFFSRLILPTTCNVKAGSFPLPMRFYFGFSC